MRHERFEHAVHLLLRLADRQPAYRIPVEPDLREHAEALPAQVVVHAALDDAEQRPWTVFERDPAASGPAHGQAHGISGRVPCRGIRCALVEGHHHVRAEVALRLDGALRRQEHLVAVDRRAERDTLLVHLAQVRQAEHLEAAGVREDRSRPLHETVQAAEVAHGSVPGAQHEVEGVAEEHLRPGGGERVRRHRLDGAVGAAGHEDWGLDRAVGRAEPPATGRAIGTEHLEISRGQSGPVHGEASPSRSQNMASP